ncbi:MAG: hypothetical protein ABIB98_03310, partial [bacterium]
MMFRAFLLKIKNTIFRPEVLFFFIVAIIELIYVQIMFNNAEFLAGGDNYTYLQLGRRVLNFYTWDVYSSLGNVNHSIPDLLGFPLYSRIASFFSIPTPLFQKLLIFCLYFFRFVGFYKLTRLLSRRFSVFALLPAVIFFSFNAFASLDAYSLFPLMYGVYLPLSLYYFIKLSESEGLNFSCVFKLLVLSVIFSPINSNPALSVTIFVPQVLYLIFSIKNMNKARVLNILNYYIIFVLVNLWWVTPMFLYYVENANRVFKSGWFSASSVGHLYQNFRLIGQWGWYGKHFLYAYYPFSGYYDLPTVLLSGYALVIFAIISAFRKGSKWIRGQNFFLSLFLLSLFLVGGSRPPFGFIYSLLFNYLPGFKIFREPFTKFGELYVLSVSILFYMALLNIEKCLGRRLKIWIFVVAMALVVINTKPVLLGEHVWDKWNGSVRTSRVRIPDYWKDFEKYQQDNFKDVRIFTTPKSYYGGAWNWIYGFSSADDVAVNFVSHGNSILRNPLATGSEFGEVIDNIFRVENLPENYLALLSIDYILQENDLDWRYAGELTLPPSKNDAFIKNLGVEKVKEFGSFTSRDLSKIPNGEPNRSLRNELYTELENRPCLVLYKVLDTLPKFYIPSKLIYSLSTISDLPYILQISSAPKDVGVFIEVLNKDNKGFLL